MKNSPFVENKCLNNIIYIYQHSGKCDDQQNLKDIIYYAMLSTTEGVSDVSSSLRITKTTVKKLSAIKSLCLFTKIFDVRKRIAIRRVEAAKSKLRAIKVVNSLCTNY